MNHPATCCSCGCQTDSNIIGVDFLRDMGLSARATSMCEACHDESLSEAYRDEHVQQAGSLLERSNLPPTVPDVPLSAQFRHWLDGDMPGAFFYGVTGVGKTVQCCALAREWIERTGTAALYRLEGDMFDRLSDYDHGDPREEFRRLRDAGLLIIDDLGTSRFSDFKADAMFRVVDARYQDQRKRTVFVTNLAPNKIRKDAHDPATPCLIDARVFRRMGDLCGAFKQIKGPR